VYHLKVNSKKGERCKGGGGAEGGGGEGNELKQGVRPGSLFRYVTAAHIRKEHTTLAVTDIIFNQAFSIISR
jgi:hypothetical protein